MGAGGRGAERSGAPRPFSAGRHLRATLRLTGRTRDAAATRHGPQRRSSHPKTARRRQAGERRGARRNSRRPPPDPATRRRPPTTHSQNRRRQGAAGERQEAPTKRTQPRRPCQIEQKNSFEQNERSEALRKTLFLFNSGYRTRPAIKRRLVGASRCRAGR